MLWQALMQKASGSCKSKRAMQDQCGVILYYTAAQARLNRQSDTRRQLQGFRVWWRERVNCNNAAVQNHSKAHPSPAPAAALPAAAAQAPPPLSSEQSCYMLFLHRGKTNLITPTTTDNCTAYSKLRSLLGPLSQGCRTRKRDVIAETYPYIEYAAVHDPQDEMAAASRLRDSGIVLMPRTPPTISRPWRAIATSCSCL